MSSAIQAALLLPAVFSMLFLALQFGLHYWASAAALAAAQDGARAAAGYQSTVDTGIAVARNSITTDTLTSVSVTGTRTTTLTTITVTGQALSVIPGWTQTVTKTASVPTERLTR